MYHDDGPFVILIYVSKEVVGASRGYVQGIRGKARGASHEVFATWPPGVPSNLGRKPEIENG